MFGEPVNNTGSQTKTEGQPVAVYHLDKTEVSNGKISDKTGRNGDLELYGSYSTDYSVGNSEQTKYFGETTQPIYFSGSDGCYAKLPDGLLSGTDAFTISIRARSSMDFSKAYFTLGLGNDSTQYLLFKLGADKVRFNMTNNSWMGETGIKVQADGANWHTYTMTVDETTAKLYIDEELVGENYTMGTLLTDFGNSAKLYLGKSFYSSDQYFNGSIASISFYDYALSEEDVEDMTSTVYYVENGSQEEGGSDEGEDSGKEDGSDESDDSGNEDGSDQTISGTENLWTGSVALGSWSNAVEISDNLEGWNTASLKVSFAGNSGAQLQLACFDANGSWVQLVDYVDVSGDSYTHELSSAELETLKTAQKIIIKGQNATVTSVDVIGTKTNGGDSSTEDGGSTGGSTTEGGNSTGGSSEGGSSSGTVTSSTDIISGGIYFDDGTWNWKEQTVTFNAPESGNYQVTVVAQSGDASAWFKVTCNNTSLWNEGQWCDGNWNSVTKTATISLNAGENTFVFGGNMKVKYDSCIITKVED